MKLSARDRQRLPWILVALGSSGILLYAYLHFLVQPIMQARAAGCAQLGTLRDMIAQAERDLQSAAAQQAEFDTLQADLTAATNRLVLRPVLGSLLMSAQSELDPTAQACGLSVEGSYLERGRTEIPAMQRGAASAFDLYAMELNASGSFAALRDFLAEVERTNRFIGVTELVVLARPENPLRHRITVRLEWPVFGERRPAADKGRPGNGPRTAAGGDA
jgi:hypothetical protein